MLLYRALSFRENRNGKVLLRKSRVVVFTLSLSLVLLLSLSTPSHSSSAAASSPRVVTVDMYIINVGNVNQQLGSYSVDMYLSFTWQGNWSATSNNASAPALPSRFEFTNGQITTMNLIEADRNISGTGYNYLDYRVKGTFYAPFNFERYPLDKQVLLVNMEDGYYNNATLVYAPSNHSMLDPAVQIPGWIIQNGSTSLSISNHLYNTTFGYPNSLTTAQSYYSRATFSITVSRPVTTSLLQLGLPTIVLVVLSMIMFRISMENFDSRLQVGVISIFTGVAFLLSLDSNIPASGYFTLADQMMVTIFATILYSIAMTVWFHRYDPKNLPTYIRRINTASFALIPIVVIDLLILLIVF